jgi:cyclopropane fatty-acyl-phospholipid synthase-like methyltransferase
LPPPPAISLLFGVGVLVFSELLNRYFKHGQHVLDPFCGSGTTTIKAGKKFGLKVTGIEIDNNQIDAFNKEKSKSSQ